MQKSYIVFGLFLLLSTGCFQNTSRIENDEVRFSVQGPVPSDTSVHKRYSLDYEQYLLSINCLQKNIYVPFFPDSNIYHVTNHNAFKEINQDTIYTSGGKADYFSQYFRLLKKGKDYEFLFFLAKPEFVPDTILIWFEYYPDSLTAKPRTLKIAHAFYR
ncbi:MAG: hypothetical protein H6562_06340 [Lewinellaceae bacterium]|nr:hypothetical protein [Lewinellaceae bacterium]